MAKIIEQTCNTKLENIMTVVSERGVELSVNADNLVKAFADMLSNIEHNEKNGFELYAQWYRDAIETLKKSSVCS